MEFDSEDERVKKVMAFIDSIPKEKWTQISLVQQMNRRVCEVLELGRHHEHVPSSENIFTASVTLVDEGLSVIGTHAEWFMMLLHELRREMESQYGPSLIAISEGPRHEM